MPTRGVDAGRRYARHTAPQTYTHIASQPSSNVPQQQGGFSHLLLLPFSSQRHLPASPSAAARGLAGRH